jgi:hypothetical protein
VVEAAADRVVEAAADRVVEAAADRVVEAAADRGGTSSPREQRWLAADVLRALRDHGDVLAATLGEAAVQELGASRDREASRARGRWPGRDRARDHDLGRDRTGDRDLGRGW